MRIYNALEDLGIVQDSVKINALLLNKGENSMKKDNSYAFLGAIYPISKRSFYLRLIGVVSVFIFAFSALFYFGYNFIPNFGLLPFL